MSRVWLFGGRAYPVEGAPSAQVWRLGTLPGVRSPVGLNHVSLLKHHVYTKTGSTLCKIAISTNKSNLKIRIKKYVGGGKGKSVCVCVSKFTWESSLWVEVSELLGHWDAPDLGA